MIGVLRCITGGKADGGKGDDSYQRTSQQRPFGLVDHSFGNVEFFCTPLHTYKDSLGDNNGIVYHHAQSDYESTKRNPMHGYTTDAHSG